jgi:hypothetical protein
VSDALPDSESPPGWRDDIPALPDDSRIDVFDATDERLVLHIRPGNRRTTCMGWGVLASIIFVCYLSQPHVFAEFQGRPKFYLYFAGFWFITIWGLAYWARLQFERTTLLVEHRRVVIQRTLFGWKRIEEVPFGDEPPWALLVDSFRGHFAPKHLVGIGRVTFGRMLTDAEKRWLVIRMNRFLHPGEESE